MRDALLADCARYPHSAPWADLLPTPSTVSLTKIRGGASPRPQFTPAGETIAVMPGIAEWISSLGSLAPPEVIRVLVPAEFRASENLQIIQGRKVVAGLQMYTYHSLLIGHGDDEETGEIVKSSLDRMASNLWNQMGLMQRHSTRKVGA